MKKLIKVTIKAEQTVYYNQEIEMSQEDFNKLYNLEDNDVCEIFQNSNYRLVETHVNTSEVFDTDNEFKNVEVSINH